jgi:glycosyltransferase involved in cell wall biosynthesis
LRQLMEERYPAAKDVDLVVAHDGVDLARFVTVPTPEAAKLAAGRDPTRSIAGYAGHLYEGRGVEVILACAKALPNWTFLVAGGTPEAIAAVKQQCRALALQNVELLGFVANAQLPSRLAVCDVLVMPYQRRVMVSGGRLDTAQWMSPLKMFEYMAMGRAIVASDLPVLREVLDDTCSILVEPSEPAEWIAALRRVAGNPSLLDALSAMARQSAKRYEWSERVRRMLAGVAELDVQAA